VNLRQRFREQWAKSTEFEQLLNNALTIDNECEMIAFETIEDSIDSIAQYGMEGGQKAR
jgi:hypothetical protein